MKTRSHHLIWGIVLTILACLNLTATAFYNPHVGRWAARDPIAEGDGPNIYAAFWNNPVNVLDTNGSKNWYYRPSPWNYLSRENEMPNLTFQRTPEMQRVTIPGDGPAFRAPGSPYIPIPSVTVDMPTGRDSDSVGYNGTDPFVEVGVTLAAPIAVEVAYGVIELTVGSATLEAISEGRMLAAVGHAGVQVAVGKFRLLGKISKSTSKANECCTTVLVAIDKIDKPFATRVVGGIESCTVKTAVPRNPNIYEALYEAPISGTSRAAHRASANEFLAIQLRSDTQLGGMFNKELGGNVLQHMQSGRSGLLNPPGTVWHHPFDNPNIMRLLRTGEHTAPPLQSVLHPGGAGGFGNFYGP